MLRKRLVLIIVTAVAAAAALASPAAAASNGNCLGRFASTVAPVSVPFGQTVVVPEVRNLTFGGPNLGQEVKFLFATANRDACPITP